MARRRVTVAACALGLLASAGLTACESSQVKAREGAEREGLSFRVGSVDYNVFITRELNLRIQEDKAYYQGPQPRKDELLYGVFLQACNKTGQPQQTADTFFITDNQGKRFDPTELPKTNAFAYQPLTLKPGTCIPETGSVAQLGPTAGAMLLFKLPLQNFNATTSGRPPAPSGRPERRWRRRRPRAPAAPPRRCEGRAPGRTR
jgi:hypothetical protein